MFELFPVLVQVVVVIPHVLRQRCLRGLNGKEGGCEYDRSNGVPERDARYFLIHVDEVDFLGENTGMSMGGVTTSTF